MIKFVCMLMMIPLFFSCQPVSLPDCLLSATEFVATNNGSEIVFGSDEQVAQFNDLFAAAFDGAIRVPALGVSLHDDTIKARGEGIWIELFYPATQSVDGMSFDSLLFRVDKDISGVTLIRRNEGIYQGRCFYINLEKNLDEIYDFLTGLPALEPRERNAEPQIEVFAHEPNDEKEGGSSRPRVIKQGSK